MKIMIGLSLCCSALLALALFYPYGYAVLSFGVWGLAIANFLTGIILLFRYWPRTRKGGAAMLVWFAASNGLLFVCVTRQRFDAIIPLQINGRVSKLYRSYDHNNPGVEVTDDSQEKTMLVPIPESTWAALKVGDRVVKQAFAMHLERGDERLPAVEASLFHRVRGARP